LIEENVDVGYCLLAIIGQAEDTHKKRGHKPPFFVIEKYPKPPY
jgi:hypothetical protein